MANSLRIHVDTMDTLNGDAMERLFGLYNKDGWFTFNVHQIEAADIVDLPPVHKEGKKTQSQLLRAVLFRVWERDKRGMEFEAFYESQMEKLINHYKKMLD